MMNKGYRCSCYRSLFQFHFYYNFSNYTIIMDDDNFYNLGKAVSFIDRTKYPFWKITIFNFVLIYISETSRSLVMWTLWRVMRIRMNVSVVGVILVSITIEVADAYLWKEIDQLFWSKILRNPTVFTIFKIPVHICVS